MSLTPLLLNVEFRTLVLKYLTQVLLPQSIYAFSTSTILFFHVKFITFFLGTNRFHLLVKREKQGAIVPESMETQYEKFETEDSIPDSSSEDVSNLKKFHKVIILYFFFFWGISSKLGL